jgi:hypothetical protein
MSIVSPLHQLLNAATGHSYLHTLRWKDRPLQCPRCQSYAVGPWVLITTDQGANATAAETASVPSTTSPAPCSTAATLPGALDARHLAAVPVVLIPAHRQELGVPIRTSYRWC